MSGYKNYLLAVARVLMASLFIWEGMLQLRNPDGTGHYFVGVGLPLPGITVWISVVIHLVGGTALLVGFKTRCAAIALVLVCLGTAFGVHLRIGDTTNMLHFYKNLVMAGGFLYVIAFGPGAVSIDGDQASA